MHDETNRLDFIIFELNLLNDDHLCKWIGQFKAYPDSQIREIIPKI